jgi:hypothetical protein
MDGKRFLNKLEQEYTINFQRCILFYLFFYILNAVCYHSTHPGVVVTSVEAVFAHKKAGSRTCAPKWISDPARKTKYLIVYLSDYPR